MSNNIIKLLEKRQVCSWNWNSDNLLVQTLRKRSVRLAAILNRNLQGHVVLGFSHRGDCIISYFCQGIFQEYKYWLYWWHFDLCKQLVLVSKVELFRDEILMNHLHIVVYEDGINAYILGCSNSNGLESKPCYVSIIQSQSPCQRYSCDTPAIHFKFELYLPHPCVYVTMEHSFSGCLLLNTGISLLCVTYQPPSNENYSSVQTQFTTRDEKHFVVATSTKTAVSSTSMSSTFMARTAGNNDTSIPMAFKVFIEDEPMVLLSPPSDRMISEGLVVKQTTLDVDSWICRILPLVLKDKQYNYHCLCDYNVKVIEMDPQCNVIFVLAAVVQVYHNIKLQCIKGAVTVIGKWHMDSGRYKLLLASHLEQVSNANKWFQLLTNLAKKHSTTTLPYFLLKGLSNKTVFTGSSLEAISHPYLPLSLIL